MPAVAIADTQLPFGEGFVQLPANVVGGAYRINPPLVRSSRLTSKAKGGVGKQLSDGWCCNFAVGCTHACPFCYVDEIHKRFGRGRYGDAVTERWGDYLLVPQNLETAIRQTPWGRWAGQEVMMSSTHDPYLPATADSARKILERALPEGVHFCIQTRSYLIRNDLAFLRDFADQVRLQVSLSTANRDFSRVIEPRVPPPEARLNILRMAKAAGLDVGVILAPIFPPTSLRPDVVDDLERMAEYLQTIQPQHIYGESLHVRGQNLRLVEQAIGEPVRITPGFDRGIAKVFHERLRVHGLRGTWWPEH